jgi:TRAP transporter TAXI family solute receptor
MREEIMSTKLLKTLLLLIAVSSITVVAQAQQMQFFRIASGSAGGTYFPMAGLIAQVIANPPGSRPCDDGGNCGMENLVAVAQAAHGSVANVNSINSGQVESGFVQSDVTYWAYTGTGPFEGKEPIQKLCVLTSLFPEHVQVVAGLDSGINSVADLKGKNVGMGLPASGALVGAQLVVGVYGLQEEKDFRVEYVSTQMSADMIRDGHSDAFITVTGYPSAGITELTATKGAKLIPVDGAERDKLLSEVKFYSKATIPGGTYKGNDKDIETVAVNALWVSSSELPEDLHYGVVKGLFGNPLAEKILQSGHAKGRSVTLDTAFDGVPIPLCPGAEKFYKYVGAIN